MSFSSHVIKLRKGNQKKRSCGKDTVLCLRIRLWIQGRTNIIKENFFASMVESSPLDTLDNATKPDLTTWV